MRKSFEQLPFSKEDDSHLSAYESNGGSFEMKFNKDPQITAASTYVGAKLYQENHFKRGLLRECVIIRWYVNEILKSSLLITLTSVL